MAVAATLRQSGGSIILAIPKAIAESMSVQPGSVVELTIEGRRLSVMPVRQGLSERLAASPKTPGAWRRDDESLVDGPVGRELL